VDKEYKEYEEYKEFRSSGVQEFRSLRMLT